MPDPPDVITERGAALAFAVQLHKADFDPRDAIAVRDTATVLFNWLTGPVALSITAGPEIDQTTGRPGNPEGTPMKDTGKFPITITAEDAKLQPTTAGTDIRFTSADENVATITTDPDGTVWVVAGLPGSTVITADWPDSPGGDLQGTLAVDVTAGDATSLVLTAGSEVPQ